MSEPDEWPPSAIAAHLTENILINIVIHSRCKLQLVTASLKRALGHFAEFSRSVRAEKGLLIAEPINERPISN